MRCYRNLASAMVVLLFVLSNLVVPILGYSQSPSEKLDLSVQLQAAREKVERLEASAYEEFPELYLIEEKLKEAKKISDTEEMRDVRRRNRDYIQSLLDNKEVMKAYHQMRASFLAQEEYKQVSEAFDDNMFGAIIIESGRFLYKRICMDFNITGEVVLKKSDAEIKDYLLGQLRRDAEEAAVKLEEVLRDYSWPSYVVRYCELWAEEETAVGGLQILLQIRTPEELIEARQQLTTIEIKVQNENLENQKQEQY